MVETLDEHEAGHTVRADDLVPFLRGGFPWHTPDVAHPELSTPAAWWKHVEALLACHTSGSASRLRERESLPAWRTTLRRRTEWVGPVR